MIAENLRRLKQTSKPGGAFINLCFPVFSPRDPLQKILINCKASLVPNLWGVPGVTLLRNTYNVTPALALEIFDKHRQYSYTLLYGHPLNAKTSLLRKFVLSLGKESPYIFSKFNPLNTDTPLIWILYVAPQCPY